MDNVKNDNYYIQKIRQDLEFIVIHMKDVDIEELNENEILQDSMLFRMIKLLRYLMVNSGCSTKSRISFSLLRSSGRDNLEGCRTNTSHCVSSDRMIELPI